MNHSTRSKTAAARATERALVDETSQKIQAKINNHESNSDGEEPPFTTAELLVIALFMSQKALLPRDIIRWILKHFKYYNKTYLDERTRGAWLGQKASEDQPDSIMSTLYAAFDSWQAPLFSAKKDEVVSSISARKNSSLIMVPSPAETREFLPSIFGQPDCPLAAHQTKSLSDLPVELKAMIFDPILQFGYQGVAVTPDGYRLYRRQNESGVLIGGKSRLALPSNTLALLSVSKQVRADALPSFLSNNMFTFSSIHAFAQFVKPRNRIELIKDVCIKYKPDMSNLKHFPSAAKVLSNMKPLRSIELVLMDGWWLEPSFPRFQSPVQALAIKPSHIPGIQDFTFALSRARSYKFHGIFPQIKQWLGSRIHKLKLVAERSKEVNALNDAKTVSEARSFKEAERVVSARKQARKAMSSCSASESLSPTHETAEYNEHGNPFDFVEYDKTNGSDGAQEDSQGHQTNVVRKKTVTKDAGSSHSAKAVDRSQSSKKRKRISHVEYYEEDTVDWGDGSCCSSISSSEDEGSAKRRKAM